MAKAQTYALILAGGRGTRFWPRSRTQSPKQLLSFLGEQSLLQQTVHRLQPLVPPERVWILTNDYLRAAIRKQLPEVPARQILAEPAQRNTAPCLALAAQVIAQSDPNAVLGVFPADHYITKPTGFRRFVKAALRAANSDKLVTLGIEPRWPETGYGYLELPSGVKAGSLDALLVKRFHEKPDLATARRFLKAKRFFWNAGMFFWRAETFLTACHRFLPETADLLATLPRYGHREFGARLNEVYPRAASISVDFAVMEPASKQGQVVSIATDNFGWNDLGSWNAVYELSPDASLRTPVVVHDSCGCLVDAPGKLVALVGVKDLVVVDTADALLVASREHAQDVGRIVKVLEQQKRRELL
jgi:mannose-1-phosphate guanylyltransferase